MASVTQATVRKEDNFTMKQKKQLYRRKILFGITTVDEWDKKKEFLSSVRRNTLSNSQSHAAEKDIGSPFRVMDDLNSHSLRPAVDPYRQNSCVQRLVIKKESSWKNVFDYLILFLAAYSITVNAYYAAFGTPTNFKQILIDYIVEVFFLLDICFSFCQEFIDQETFNVESNIHAIALNYIKTRFVFDLLAVLPLDLLLKDYLGKLDKLLRLLKWLRMPRLAIVLDQARFKTIISRFFEARMEARY